MKRMRSGGWLVVLGVLGASPAVAGFTDVTASAGISQLQYQVTVPPSVNMPFYMSGGAAAGDVDGDGWPDLYVTRLDGPDSLYLNQRDGTFVEDAAARGLGANLPSNGAGFGDIDNDGDLDLYVTTMGPGETRFHLYVNQGDGSFVEEAQLRGAAIEGPDDHYGYGVAFGDYDGDGWLDLHTTEWRMDGINPTGALSNSRLLRNRGTLQPGFFDDVTQAAGVALDAVPPAEPAVSGTFGFASEFADLDEDGCPDLLVAGDFGTSRLFWNDCDGTFTDGTVAAGVGTDENGMGHTVGDYDGDGLLDWFVTAIFDPNDSCETVPGAMCFWGDTGNRLFRNEGGRVFSDQTDAAGVRDGYWGWGASFFEADNDGDLDLVMVNGIDFPFADPATTFAFSRFNPDPMRFWENDGLGGMTEASAANGLTDQGSGKGLLTVDYDRDGDLDVLVLNNAGTPVLYRNDDGQDNDWLQVSLEGSVSNRQGIGARIEVEAVDGGPVQVREVRAGSHFLGQSEARAHFGFGAPTASSLHRVTITWPASGITTTLRDVPRRAALRVRESAAPATTKARYSIRFDATWSATSHPVSPPPDPHFSPLVGGSHSSAISFWGPGQLASSGIEIMAETGDPAPLTAEIDAAVLAGIAREAFLGGAPDSPGTATASVELSQAHPLLTATTMIAPSPDWFVGVHDLSLFDGERWIDELVIPLRAYDAGTDDGASFLDPDADTQPREPISLITTPPLANGGPSAPLGRFVIQRIDTDVPALAYRHPTSGEIIVQTMDGA